MTDWAQKAQRLGEERLAGCQDALWADEHDAALGVASGAEESPASAPFCGCDTCIVREVLDAAYPALLELAREEVRQEARTDA